MSFIWDIRWNFAATVNRRGKHPSLINIHHSIADRENLWNQFVCVCVFCSIFYRICQFIDVILYDIHWLNSKRIYMKSFFFFETLKRHFWNTIRISFNTYCPFQNFFSNTLNAFWWKKNKSCHICSKKFENDGDHKKY